jgi:hypothetical protein
MARSGLTKSQVRAVRARLQADGRYPSVDAVRHALGDSGSKSTIHKYLKELRDEDPGAAVGREDTEDALRAIVAQLAERLHANAEERIRALRAAHEQALREKDAELLALRAAVTTLREKDAELLALRAAVTTLTERLALSEAQGLPGDWHPQRQLPRQARAGNGFGRFDSALMSSRSGQGDSSPFDMIRAVARS